MRSWYTVSMKPGGIYICLVSKIATMPRSFVISYTTPTSSSCLLSSLMSCDSSSVVSLVGFVLVSAVPDGDSSLTSGLAVGGIIGGGGFGCGRTGRVMISDFLLLLNFALPLSSLIG